MAKLSVPITDHKGDLSVARLPVDDAIIDTDITSFVLATAGMVAGNYGQTSLDFTTPKDTGPGGNPTNPKAQVENKWLVKYHDTVVVTNVHTMEIPCADSALKSANTDNLDLAAGAGLSFKTAFEATAKSPKTGNAVVIDEVISVARNL